MSLKAIAIKHIILWFVHRRVQELFKMDLHVHTVRGSTDSSLLPSELIMEAARIGLDGVLLAEHGGGWTTQTLSEDFCNTSLVVIPAIEVTTDMGHIIAIGLDYHVSGIHKLSTLRKVIDRIDGILIAAHPMRNFFNRPPYNTNLLYKDWEKFPESIQEAAEHEVFKLVDYLEVTNGANSDTENQFTKEMSTLIGLRGTGGSDSHSKQGLGKSLTVFETPITDKASLIQQLKKGAFYPAEGLNIGNLRKF